MQSLLQLSSKVRLTMLKIDDKASLHCNPFSASGLGFLVT